MSLSEPYRPFSDSFDYARYRFTLVSGLVELSMTLPAFGMYAYALAQHDLPAAIASATVCLFLEKEGFETVQQAERFRQEHERALQEIVVSSRTRETRFTDGSTESRST